MASHITVNVAKDHFRTIFNNLFIFGLLLATIFPCSRQKCIAIQIALNPENYYHQGENTASLRIYKKLTGKRTLCLEKVSCASYFR